MDHDAIPIELDLYSIQWFKAAPGPCCRCARPVGAGPAGFSTDQPAGPLCDACLLDLHKELGTLVWFLQMVRELAEKASTVEDPWKADQLMVALMAFATMYDQGAQWPRRDAQALGFYKQLQQGSTWKDLLRALNAPAN